ncbi:VWA domain-containing protein [Myxococcota bacterium]
MITETRIVHNRAKGGTMGHMRGGKFTTSLCCGLLLSSCGDDTECDHGDQCPTGSYCAAGTCQTECTPGSSTCASGICTQYGRCALDQPDPDSGVCAAMVLEAEFGTPTVVLLIDQSRSMNDPIDPNDPSSTPRWNVMRDALIDPATGVIGLLESTIRFGLTLYTGTDATCPVLTVVDPAIDNLAAITTIYQDESPISATPTGDSIDAIVPTLAAYPEPGPKHIVLATDGEPNTCEDLYDMQGGRVEAVAAAQAAFNSGITLFILSVGSISQEHLQDMANAGVGYTVGGTLNAPFYEAGDATQLSAAFDEITGRVLTCELTVNGSIDADAVSSGVIFLDGDQLTLGDEDGWETIDDTSFRLLGSACDQVQREGGHTVTAQFGCEPVDTGGLHVSGGGAVDRGCSAVHVLADFSFCGMALLTLLVLRWRRKPD